MGKDVLQKLGFDPVDFHMICHMSSWAVCGVRPGCMPREGRCVEQRTKELVDLKMNGASVSMSESCQNTTQVETMTHDQTSGTPLPRPYSYIPHPKESVGIKCKRLIDFARVCYLRDCGFDVKLVNYVDRVTSLENVLLVVRSKHLQKFK